MSLQEKKIFSSDWQITTQDVPDEISLAISLSGCPLHCTGCHSSFTWDPCYGTELTDDIFENLLLKNKHISCVLFYGGEWVLPRLLELINITKKHKLAVCLYTGLTMPEVKQNKPELLDVLNYIKVGRWVEHLGGLNSRTTNQRMYKIVDHQFEDITDKFYKE